ncbi:MAG: hypothetical protein V7646_1518 [Pseudonocardia sp.]
MRILSRYMSVLFVGAGAVSAASAALLHESCEVGVTSLSAPQSHMQVSRASHSVRLPARVTSVDAMPWSDAISRRWDAVVFTWSPKNVAEEVYADLIKYVDPRLVATTSQVPGDFENLAARLPFTSTIMLVPRYLSYRTHDRPSASFSYWLPPGSSPFFAAGSPQDLMVVKDVLGSAALAATSGRLLQDAARTMPFAAELVIQKGDWASLSANLTRPRLAAKEALRSLGHQSTLYPPKSALRLALALLPAIAPFDLKYYSANHFSRHANQTLTMLDQWINRSPEGTPALQEQRRQLALRLHGRPSVSP